MNARQTILACGLLALTLAACATAAPATTPPPTEEAEPTTSAAPPTQTEPPPTVEATPDASDTPLPPTDTPTSEATSFSSCEAVGREQIEAIIGALSSEPQNFDSVGEGVGYFGGCLWESGAAFVALTFGPLMGGDAQAYWAQVTNEEGLEPVPELSVEAWWRPRDEYTGSLFAMRDDIVLELLVSSATARTMAIQIMEIALVRIPPGGGR